MEFWKLNAKIFINLFSYCYLYKIIRMGLSIEERKEKKKLANKMYQEKLKEGKNSAISQKQIKERQIEEPEMFEKDEIIEMPQNENPVVIEEEALKELLRIYQKYAPSENNDVEKETPQPTQNNNQNDFFFSIQQNLISTAIGMLPLIAMKLMQGGEPSQTELQTNTRPRENNTSNHTNEQQYQHMQQCQVRSVNLC